MPPPGTFSCLGTPSGSECNVAGRSYATQCTHVPDGASGSSTTNAKLWVLEGGSAQESAGEASAPWQENWTGMLPPASNAGLVSAKAAGEALATEGAATEAARSAADFSAGAGITSAEESDRAGAERASANTTAHAAALGNLMPQPCPAWNVPFDNPPRSCVSLILP